MKSSKGKIIYNILISILMGYFLVRSLLAFLGYIFYYEDKLYATLTIQVKLHEPLTGEQVKSTFSHANTKVIPEPDTKSILIKSQASKYTDLPELKNKLLTKLQKKLPDGSYSIEETQFLPPEVSTRILRLELFVYIPAFAMALFWFFYLFRWLKEERLAGNKKAAGKQA